MQPEHSPFNTTAWSQVSRLHKNIHLALIQNDAQTVEMWLSSLQGQLPQTMMRHLWTQSIRCNQTEQIFTWMRQHDPALLENMNKGIDVEKMLTSPRAWKAMKKEHLAVTMDVQSVARVIKKWNKNIADTSRNFLSAKGKEQYGAYFQECSDIQIDFFGSFRCFVPRKNIIARPKDESPVYPLFGKNPSRTQESPVQAIVFARARAMATSKNADMWMLACMEKKQLGLACYLSLEPTVSRWWETFLEQHYPTEYDAASNWQRQLSVKSMDVQVTSNIAIAYELCAGTTTMQERLSTMLNMMEEKTHRNTETIDLPVIDFETISGY